MRESISYTFLLNIVIVFVFTCFAIIMGVLSYYKAFRANTIISETIEKYEGYNCVSAEEIKRKLDDIGYNTPFNVNCNGKGDYCMTDTAQNYAVVSYNLDILEENKGANIIFKDSDAYKYTDKKSAEKFKVMNSTYKCDENGCTTNKHYQYGIYTYMYVELPVVSGLIRIPFFSKTSTMYEFRDFYVNTEKNEKKEDKTKYMDVTSSYENLYTKKEIDGKVYVKDDYINKCQLEVIDNEDGTYTEKCVYKSARQTISDALLRSYAVMSGTNEEGANAYQIIVRHITDKSTLDYRTRAITVGYSDRIDNHDNKGVSLNSLAASATLRGVNQRQFCGFIMDYSKIN